MTRTMTPDPMTPETHSPRSRHSRRCSARAEGGAALGLPAIMTIKPICVHVIAAAVVVAGGAPTAAAAAASSQRWAQDVFGISNWVTPALDPARWQADMEFRLSEFAGANFTVMLGTMGTPSQPWDTCVLAQAAGAAKHGLKIIPGLPINGSINRSTGVSTAIVRDVDERILRSPSFWGFDFYDECATCSLLCRFRAAI